MPRRGRGGPGLTTIYWRDIPAQVTATTEDGGKEQVLMHDRFQVAIDRPPPWPDSPQPTTT